MHCFWDAELFIHFPTSELSPDECLEKYVKEHDIVDIDHPDGHRHNLQTIDEESNDFDDFDDGEGDEINDDTFPDCEKEDEILDHHPLERGWDILPTDHYGHHRW